METEDVGKQIEELKTKDHLTRRERRYLEKLEKKLQKGKSQKKINLKKIAVYVVISILIGLLGYGLYIFIKNFGKPLPGTFVQSMGNRHIDSVDTLHEEYNSKPPTSGPHIGSIAKWGIHDEPIPDELQIHNLEDGGVMIQYNCDTKKDDCQKLIKQLEEIVKKYNEKVILAPYHDMESRLALTAWTRIDTLDEFDEERIQTFIKSFRGIDNH